PTATYSDTRSLHDALPICHRTQARPEGRCLEVAAGEQIGDRQVERCAACGRQILGEARHFRHAANADAVAKTGDGNLVALIENRSEEHTSELQSRENLVCR